MRINREILDYLDKYNKKYPERMVILCNELFFKTIENKYYGKFIYYILTIDLEAASRLKSSIQCNEIMQYGMRVISLQNEFKNFLSLTPSIDAIILNNNIIKYYSLIVNYLNNVNDDKEVLLFSEINQGSARIGKVNIKNTVKIKNNWLCRICIGGGKLAIPKKEYGDKFKEQELENEEHEYE